MKAMYCYYICDNISETIRGSFLAPNSVVAERNFSNFLRNLPPEVNVSDFDLRFSNLGFDMAETYDEIVKGVDFRICLLGNDFIDINRPLQPELPNING